MNQQQNPTSEEKTSTGLPIKQPFTPPIGKSFRPASARRPEENVFANVFPDSEADKRPFSTTIAKPQTEVFSALMNINNLPQFFDYLEKVESIDENSAIWHIKNDDGLKLRVNIDASMTGDKIIWRSEDPAGFPFTLAVHLEKAQADRGTIVRMMTSYDSSVGNIVGLIEKLFEKDATTMAKKTLQRFRAFCETGHVPTTEGQPSGRDEDSTIISTSSKSSTLKH